MFTRSSYSTRLPNMLKQFKTKRTPRLECRNCQQTLSQNSLGMSELPFLWSPEVARLMKLTSKTGNESGEFTASKTEQNLMSLSNCCVQEKDFNQLLHQRSPLELIPHSKTATLLNMSCKRKPCAVRASYSKSMLNRKTQIHRAGRTDYKGAKKLKCYLGACHERKAKDISYFCDYQNKAELLCTSKRQFSDKIPGSEELMIHKTAERLADEWPRFFSTPIDVSLCSDQIYFDNTVLRIKTRGIRFYKLQAFLFKWITKSLWFEPTLRILQLTKHTEENSIKIRWQITGRPKILYPLEILGKTPSLRYLDYFSILHLGEDEKIAIHRLTKVVPTQKVQKRNPLMSLLALLGLSGTKMHIPPFEEEPVIPSSGGPS